MIPIVEFSGKTVAVLGLGRTGLSAARALTAGGAKVIGWDDMPARRQEAISAVFEICDLSRRDMSDLSALILSPGIAHTFPKPNHIVALARACGVPILGDVELLARLLADLPDSRRPKLIGITGTNGKSTTTALVTHILQSAKLDAKSGGNIGRACLDLPKLRKGQIHVLELSSYQLEITTSLRCDIACLLNISPDHLERHGGMENYAQAKAQIFANQQQQDLAVIGVDDPNSLAILSEISDGPGQVCAISASTTLSRGVYVAAGKLIDATGDQGFQVADLAQAPGLRGRHNWQNAAAAYAITRHLGLPAEKITKALYSFTGLAHRMEPLGQLGTVLFVNDSKATNGQAAAKSLASFTDIYWIAGGLAKPDGLGPVLPFASNIRQAYLIGDAADAFQSDLEGHCLSQVCKTLDQAFATALQDAQASDGSEPVILLAPACASFDQFDDFEHRGDHFRHLLAAAKKIQ